MTVIDIKECGPEMESLLTRVHSGEEVSISREGEVIALLVCAEDPERRRAFGMFRGRIWMSPDFNEPLSEEELKEWGL